MKKTSIVTLPRIFRFRYPKLALLMLCIVAAYALFTLPAVASFFSSLGATGYFGIFIAGMLFSFGFTTPFAIGIFVSIAPQNIILASLLGGFGALLSDLFIFKLIKLSFLDEFQRLQHTKSLQAIQRIIDKSLARRLKVYLLYALAGFIIASPLPDELGVSMLAGLTAIKASRLALISFVMNMFGIFIIFLIAH